METYIALLDFTEKGIQEIKDSPHRADRFNEMADGLAFIFRPGDIKDLHQCGRHQSPCIVLRSDAQALGLCDMIEQRLYAGGNALLLVERWNRKHGGIDVFPFKALATACRSHDLVGHLMIETWG